MAETTQRGAETRQRILTAAGHLFREHGIDGVGVDAVMKQAGLTHGGFYLHFPSKDALAAEVSQFLLEKAASRWDDISRVAGPGCGAQTDCRRLPGSRPRCQCQLLPAHHARSRRRAPPFVKGSRQPRLARHARCADPRPARTQAAKGADRAVNNGRSRRFVAPRRRSGTGGSVPGCGVREHHSSQTPSSSRRKCLPNSGPRHWRSRAAPKSVARQFLANLRPG